MTASYVETWCFWPEQKQQRRSLTKREGCHLWHPVVSYFARLIYEVSTLIAGGIGI